MKFYLKLIVTYLITILISASCTHNVSENWRWETIETTSKPTARHEAGLVAYKDKLYLIGGRRINPVSVYNPKTNNWVEKSKSPVEIHHFQPVVFEDAIYLVGAMTGQWPNERALDRVIIYYPEKDEFIYGHKIPKHRQRGSAGAVVHNNKIYVVGGITNGHMNGYKPWLDEYNPKTGKWTPLEDAPNARDHFQAVTTNNMLYTFAGRTTSKETDQDIELTVSHGNVYNFKTKKWELVTNNLAIPEERAGNGAFFWNNEIILGGGESISQQKAHNQVEAYHTETKLWRNWPKLNQGRHGTGFAIIGEYVYTASGCGQKGGEPELTSIERLKLPKISPKSSHKKVDETQVVKQFHTLTLSYKGNETSETAEDNPFLNYRFQVVFTHKNSKHTIRGFYAADGNASQTSAKSGSIWQSKFTPDKLGNWHYKATLYRGDSVALKTDFTTAKKVKISNSEGDFVVVRSDKEGFDFRAKGRLVAHKGNFKFKDSENYWLKAGTNSPENLLGYIDFDNTYRIKMDDKEGEAAAPEEIHTFKPHLKDWKTGDPNWKNNKGKSLIGAINYLAEKGMNSSYFLTMNLLGDGKDVWPYENPNTFNRFDVSKLAQWDILFEHMQSKGILLHIVLQETENETMLDNGNTGPLRQLYFNEMIARFGHHLGLVWNLGEENGPAHWSPIGQNDTQRKAMAKFLKENDPYHHPVLLHTHSKDPLRSDILDQILGCRYLDGLSLQQEKREEAAHIVEKWRKKSKKAGNEWLITMDEIGIWHTAALSDSQDPGHKTLRGDVLWGTLLSGGAGVEWYFGAKHPHNDLTSEDWRQRNQLWELTNHAKVFFNRYLPYWEMEPNHSLINSEKAYCFHKPNELYAIYLPNKGNYSLNLKQTEGSFSVEWYNPLQGGELLKGSVSEINSGGIRKLGNPPVDYNLKNQDWVVLIKKIE